MNENQKKIFVLLIIYMELMIWSLLPSGKELPVSFADAPDKIPLFFPAGLYLAMMQFPKKITAALSASLILCTMIILPLLSFGSVPFLPLLSASVGVLAGILLHHLLMQKSADHGKMADTLLVITSASTFLILISLGLYLLMH